MNWETDFRPSEFLVRQVGFREVRDFVQRGHYSNSAGKVSAPCFALFRGDAMVGAAIYGRPSGRLLAASLWQGGNDSNTLELTRLFVIDGTGRNTESWFLAQCHRMLPPSIKLVVAFAAPDAHHHGGVYQASSWLYLGVGTGNCHYHYVDGEGLYINKRRVWDYYKRERLPSERQAAAEMGLTRVAEDAKHVYVLPRYRWVRKRLKRAVLPYPKPISGDM